MKTKIYITLLLVLSTISAAFGVQQYDTTWVVNKPLVLSGPKFHIAPNSYRYYISHKRTTFIVDNAGFGIYLCSYVVNKDTIDLYDNNNQIFAQFIVKFVDAYGSITITNAKPIKLFVNYSTKLSLTVSTPPSPIIPSYSFKWTVKDTSILKISSSAADTARITAKKVGKTMVYVKNLGIIPPIKGGPGSGGAPGAGPSGENQPPVPFEVPMEDSCMVEVFPVSPCVQSQPKDSIISYCSGSSISCSTTLTGIEWYTDATLKNMVGYGGSVIIDPANTPKLYLAKNQDTCLNIVQIRTFKKTSEKVLGSDFKDALDTFCLNSQITLPSAYSRVKWFSTSDTTLLYNEGTTPPLTSVGTKTFIVQLAQECVSSLYTVSYVVRDCSHDFIPKYFISGIISSQSGSTGGMVFLKQRGNDSTYIDSVKFTVGEKYTLRVPSVGDYTILVRSNNSAFYDTYYGNKLDPSRASYVKISSSIPDSTVFEDVNITLKSYTDVSDVTPFDGTAYVANGMLYISSSETFSLAVYTVSGQLCFEQQNQQGETSFSLQQVPAGIFVAKLRFEKTGKYCRYFLKDWH